MTPAQQFITEYGRYCQAHDLTCPPLSEAGVQAALSAVLTTADAPRKGPIPFPYDKRAQPEPRHVQDEA